MIHHLRVRNLGVLGDVEIDPSPGFTVITGETGAGKTLLLGGLRLVLGKKADSSTVGPFGTEAQVDALFETAEGEVGVSRIVPKEGRSRGYLDGGIVSSDTLAARIGQWTEIIGQHDQIAITRPGRLLALVDSSMDEEGVETLEAYRQIWETYQSLLTRSDLLGGDQQALARELDLARYQAEEIEMARLSPGLDESLEGEMSKLRNVEEIIEHLAETLHTAEEIADQSGEMVSRLRKVAELDPGVASLAATAEGLMAELQELGGAVRSIADGLEQDPRRLDEVEAELNVIGDLKRKYGKTLVEVAEYGRTTRARVEELEHLLDEAERIDELTSTALAEVERAALKLGDQRRRRMDEIESDAISHIEDLGLSAARLSFEISETSLTATGRDRVGLMFASDERLESQSIGKGASGGELSRLVLALRLATREDSSTTLVFDEVDTGIGGVTALAMGRKLADLGRDAQLLCVTHLAQVAAHADKHYAIERNAQEASIRLVEGEDRVTEISRMLAGRPDSDAGRVAAAELLAQTVNS